jgi:hypothetical protein
MTHPICLLNVITAYLLLYISVIKSWRFFTAKWRFLEFSVTDKQICAFTTLISK